MDKKRQRIKERGPCRVAQSLLIPPFRMIMMLLILCATLSACQASVLVAPLRNPDDLGAAIQYRNQDSVGNYNFGYNEGHPSGGSFRKEAGDAYGNVVGSYGLQDADGRLRIVNYIADANGFRADVKTNEPGVAPQDPASATINKPSFVPAVPAPSGPLVVPAAAPVAVPAPVAFPVPAAFPPPPAKVQFVPGVPPPPPPVPFPVSPYRVPIPPFSGPLVAGYKGYPAVPPPVAPAGYVGNVVSGKSIPYPVARNYLPAALAPPGYAAAPLVYGFVNGKSLPTYQALGYS